ncbi:adenylate/guanylate cyclase domain-containing protein [Candidatus Magnetominusculus xianensis]|uniref:Adenylate cyclase n=1 Tax=Candidatus Magnetominusculus xianensis TaxID=1748249 RepID=A0ABR5SK45_9BACT|nr:adenylate/guanylate cyclase domain-containing protein [Candidatus Magnetominusculus xianensis]KWT88148.1 adenylate cyclase [Candidatus Magnetominusculus xianensis]MBF0404454.1 adenylate/guanylate cyclase domain-containing protein [Nitrospirota bacterium]
MNKLLTGIKFRTPLVVLAIGTIVSLIVIVLGSLGAFDRLEHTAIESAFLTRPPLKTDPAIISVDIDDEALQTLGRWPWPLHLHRSLIDLLKLYKSRSIILTDIDISKTEHDSMEENAAWLLKDVIKNAYMSGGAKNALPLINSGDDAFYNSLKDFGLVTIRFTMPAYNDYRDTGSLSADPLLKLLNSKIAINLRAPTHALPPAAELTLPPEGILNNIRGGGSNIVVINKQGVVSRYPLITRYNDTLYPSIALDAAVRLTGSDNITVTPGKSTSFENSASGRITIPIDKEGQTLVNWAGTYKDTFQHVPFSTVAQFIAFQETKNELKKYDLNKIQDINAAITQLTKEMKKRRYVSSEQNDSIVLTLFIAAMIENRLTTYGGTVKEALKKLQLPENETTTTIANQIVFNNYLLQKYDETQRQPAYEETLKELGYTSKEAEGAALKDLYDLVIFYLGNDLIPLVRPLYFGRYEITVNDKVQRISPLILKDKIVFYGLTATGLTSQNPTPFMKRHPMLDLPMNVLNSILTGKFLYELPRALIYAIIFALAYCIVLLVLVAAPARSGAAAVTAVVVYLALSWYLFALHGVIMPVSQPVFAIAGAYFSGVIYRYFKARNERRKVRQMFSTMVSPEVLKIIEKTPDKLNLGGEIKRATMFSSDVSGFTTISEGVTSRELADILNIYLTPMSNIIMCYDGYVDKYEGDAIKADFGVPINDAGHAWKACWAALYQQEELLCVQRMIMLQYGVGITARMGINTGMVLAGNMGSEGHIQYTVMGPAVTLAEELEPANKVFDTWIMIGHNTYEDAKDYIVARCLGSLKTHHGTETVYELAGWNKEKFLSYWEHRPIPKLLIRALKKLRPEKILGYNYYFENKPLPELALLPEIRSVFSELAELSIKYMQIRDTINIVTIGNTIDRLTHHEDKEPPLKIRNELAALRTALSNENIPYKAALLSWQIVLKQHMAQISTLNGKIEKTAAEASYDTVDRLEKAIESIKKRINCAGDITAGALSENLKDLLLRDDLKDTQNVGKLTHQCTSIERLISIRLSKFVDSLRGNPVQYHRLIAEMCSVSEERLRMFSLFEDGLRLYKLRQWDGALDAFKQCLNSSPDDRPSKKYIEEIERLKVNPPTKDWTGAWESG